VAALVSTLLAAGTVLADFVRPDADHLAGGAQGTYDFGSVAPGATLTTTVSFELVCSGLRHADFGQTVLVDQSGSTVPGAGGSITGTGTTIGPIPATWASDTAGAAACPAPMQLAANGDSTVTIVAPSVVGDDYDFTIMYAPSFDRPGVNDPSSVVPFIMVTFRMDVVDAPPADTTPPVLHDVPAGLDLVTSEAAGAVLDYVPPTATDDTDPAPIVACDPPPGDLAPLGPSEVTCTATDASGNTANASFPIVVHLVTVSWEEPVGEGGLLVVRGQRNVPVKLQAWLDGVPVTTGSPHLEVRPCGSSDVERTADLAYQPDTARWMGHLSTAGLTFGCHMAEVVEDGVSYGGFTLDLQAGIAPARTRGPNPR
jgi:hypothetical protein